MSKRPIVASRIFAKSRLAEAERLARLERMAERRRVEAADAGQALRIATQDEEAAWTVEKSKLVEAARLAEVEAESWARALVLAVREAADTLEAREALYKDTQKMVAKTLKEARKAGDEQQT